MTWVFDEEAHEECVILVINARRGADEEAHEECVILVINARRGAYFFWALGPAGVDVFLDGPVTCIACIARVAEMGRL